MSFIDKFADPSKKKTKRKTTSSGGTPGLTKEPLHKLAKTRYLNYAMSVIMSRALPDVRDGLKPVQRRILYSMYEELRLTYDKKHRKSATVVGATMGKYHPHGDSSIYEAMVRLAQDWVVRLPLVDGHGNFGNIDGDNAAAMRYTEARLRNSGTSLMREIKRGTVDFRPNFDSSSEEPEVLPAPLPLLLINGAAGIAVGMATNIPPHNVGEVIDAAVDLLKNPQRRIATLVANHIPGPDFPTGGAIVESEDEIVKVYQEGRGTITTRAKWEVEKRGRTEYLVFTEIPYGVAKQDLVAKIAQHIVDEELPLVEDVRDESTSDVRVVLELGKGAKPEPVIAYLFKHTDLESRFHVNMTCLIPDPDNPDRVIPKRLDLKEMLEHFLDFRLKTVRRRIEFDLDKLEKRIHILRGFMTVLKDVEIAISIVTKAKSKDDARDGLMKRFSIDEAQAEHVLNTRVYRFANYEVETLREELEAKEERADELRALLKDEGARKDLVAKELREVKKEFNTARRSDVGVELKTYSYDESMYIEEVDVHAIVSRVGWVRRQKSYGDLSSLRVKDNDEIGWAIASTTRQPILFFTNQGRVYTARVADLPDTVGYGEPIQSQFSFEDGEKIVSVCVEPLGEMVAVASNGKGVRFDVDKFVEPSTVAGRKYMSLDDDAEVIAVEPHTDPEEDYAILVSRSGYCHAFLSEEINKVKGAGKGVNCMLLSSKDSVVAFGIASGSRGGSLSVETSSGGTHEIRHTTHGYSSRARTGKKVLKRDDFVRWIRSPDVIT